MSALMKQALEKLRRLPEERQNELAPLVSMLADAEAAPYPLRPEDTAAIEQSRAEIAKGDIATDEQVRAVWAKYGL